jgi:hypothetical protein
VFSSQKCLDDFYDVSSAQVSRNGGYTLLKVYYDQSVARAVMEIYPEHPWRPWRFKVIPQRWWQVRSLRRVYFDDAASLLGVSNPEDWKNVQLADITRLRSSSFLSSLYGNSLRSALRDVYPTHTWDTIGDDVALSTDKRTKYPKWRVPAGHWADRTKRRQFFEDLATKHDLKSFDEWYGLSTSIVRRHGGMLILFCLLSIRSIETYVVKGGGLIARYYRNSFATAIVDLFPEHQWNPSRFFRKAKPLGGE